jgi:NAD(P)-dependent dehydrogenase (short-subunit alcohol dehydrogenase family)
MKTPALFDLASRVAVVTGGNGGIGRGIALGLAEAGAAVAVFGRNDEKNQRVLAELKAIGVPSIAVKVDVTNRDGLQPALDRVESEFGSVSILVNNAGNVSLSGGVLQEKPEDWDNVIETHLNAAFLLSKLAARSMLRRRFGAISRAAGAKRFAVLVSKKPGQKRMELARRMKDLGEARGLEMILVYLDNIEPDRLLNLGVDAAVSTACPRVALDDAARYTIPILTPPEFEMLAGERRWEEYAFDEIE